MDKIDFCLIPFIYLFQPTLTILTIATLFILTPYTIGKALKNSLTLNTIFILHMTLFVLPGFHSLVQIPIIQLRLILFQQLSIVRICLYWPRFYLSLLKHKRNRHSIWKIITNPVTPEGSPKVRKPSSIIVCLNLNL